MTLKTLWKQNAFDNKTRKWQLRVFVWYRDYKKLWQIFKFLYFVIAIFFLNLAQSYKYFSFAHIFGRERSENEKKSFLFVFHVFLCIHLQKRDRRVHWHFMDLWKWRSDIWQGCVWRFFFSWIIQKLQNSYNFNWRIFEQWNRNLHQSILRVHVQQCELI